MGFEPKLNKKKQCPFLKNLSDCLKENYALWIEIQHCCSLKLLATALATINYRQLPTKK